MLNKIIKILNIVGSTLLVFCFVVFLLLRLNIIVEVKGVSMNETYSEGELLFVFIRKMAEVLVRIPAIFYFL